MAKIFLESLSIENLKSLIREVFLEFKNNNSNSEKIINSKYLTRKEVSNLLNISLPTLNEYSKQGIIQSYRMGKRILYKSDEVENSLIQIKNLKYKR